VPEPPRVSAIVVSYHTGAPLEDCLNCLEADPALCDVIVVDNGNPPEVAAALRARAARSQKLRLVQGHGNVGFSRACNLGAARAEGAYVAFINPDVEIEPGCFDALRIAAEGARKPCVIGARIVWPDGREQRGGRRDLVTPWRAFVTALGLGRFETVSPLFRDLHREDDPVPGAPLRVGSVSGAAMLLPKDSFAVLGGFDEQYFLHVEDVDLCRRAAEAGGETLFVPDARALHHRSTSDTTSFKVERAKAASFARYFFKFARTPLDFVAACLITPPLALGFVLRGLLRDAVSGKGLGNEARMFLLFGFVGAAAFVLDAFVLTLCVGQGISREIGRIISLFVSMNFTFAVNRAFVFGRFRAAPLVQQWVLYLASNTLGALVNYAVFLALTTPGALFAGRNILAVACGSIAGLAFNFTASRLTAFRR
jgi:N-acetylglucosaminyl-diphospho-decaprenol L-rhamnosyltransferase